MFGGDLSYIKNNQIVSVVIGKTKEETTAETYADLERKQNAARGYAINDNITSRAAVIAAKIGFRRGLKIA